MYSQTKSESQILRNDLSKDIQKVLDDEFALSCIESTNPETQTDEIFKLIENLQHIIENCKNLSDKEKWNYCESQRYFIKQFLKNLNKKY
jgi:hypothetical protein